ncbi:MAG TPA: hypothetical protein VMZ53_28460 [Kofleriaceae bacterium]|nr:hypothetical protein [Kofleriaceae bacterium]
MRRAALSVLALAGCDVVFRVDHVPDAPAGDAVTADALSICTLPFIDDTFDDGTPCAPWGSPRMQVGGTVTESNGSIIVQPAPNMIGSRGGCDAMGAVPFGTGGVVAEVSHAMGGSDAEFTLLASGSLQLAVAVANNQIVFQNDIGTIQYGAAILYVPTAMRFWRIRRFNDVVITGEYSADGVAWTELGRQTVALAPTTANFGLLAGLNNNRPAQSAPDRSVYDRFVVCP